MHGDEIGGGIVRLGFTIGERRMKPGDRLTAAEINALSNGRALIRTGHIRAHPFALAQQQAAPADRHMFHIGGGRYVVSGPLLTGEPVSKEDAEAIMAGRDPFAPKALTAA
jgi:hypothetical protein